MAKHPPLQLRGALYVSPEAEDLYDALADALCAEAMRALDARGVFHLALSGGSTPEPFYVRLVTDPRYRMLPWKHTHVWLVDERRVPEDDELSNFRMIRESVLDHVPLVKRHVHPTHPTQADAAEKYESLLKELIEDGRLDFALMGMGDDGHTASLFPGSRALGERERWFIANDGPGVTPPPRLTMTFPFLNDARHLAVLVTNANKADTLRRVDDQINRGGGGIPLPITGLAPTHGHLAWYLTSAAAAADDEPLSID